MKIKITGKKQIPKAWGGLTVPPDFFNSMSQFKGVPNLQNLATVPFGINDQRDQYGNTISYDSFGREIHYDATGNRITNSSGVTGEKDNGSGTTATTSSLTHNFKMPGTMKAQMMLSGLTGVNNIAQGIKEQQDYSDYSKRLGSTDASNPVVYNAYSRGRNVMNAPSGADYAPNMMTPVQFAGKKTSEYLGYPIFPYNQYGRDGLLVAAEGLNFSNDVLGLPSMIENPDSYRDVEIPEMKGPEFTPSKGTVRVTGQAAPEQLAGEAPEVMESEFAMPVKNFKITSGFGHREAPIKGSSSEHNGVDLSVPLNSIVYAPMDGVVEKIYANDKGGKQLIIRHLDGSRSGFAHLNDYEVGIGDKVTKGQSVALSGNTGNSSGPHLHFTFRNSEGNFVDPLDYFNMNGSKKEPKGLSNYDHNNPGNIHIGNFAEKYGATPGRKDGNGRVAVFPTKESGLMAMEDLIFGPGYVDLSISKARNKWVNGNANASTTSTSSIVSSMGGDYKLRDLSPTQRKKLISEFAKWEDRKVYNNYKNEGLIFKEGGEYELDDNEINYILANGGTVEYL